jgi:hypothetical protein
MKQSGSYELVDRRTGEVVLTQIHLWPNDCGECNMCGHERQLNHAVAWYCGPTHDEIGSVSTEYVSGTDEPAVVGGMSVCKECHDRHCGIIHHSGETT